MILATESEARTHSSSDSPVSTPLVLFLVSVLFWLLGVEGELVGGTMGKWSLGMCLANFLCNFIPSPHLNFRAVGPSSSILLGSSNLTAQM